MFHTKFSLSFILLKCISCHFQEIQDTITDFVKSHIHKTSQACVVVFIGHGGTLGMPGEENKANLQSKDFVYGTDFKLRVQINWILQQFSNENCPLLKGKPKLFFIAACRGGKFYIVI